MYPWNGTTRREIRFSSVNKAQHPSDRQWSGPIQKWTLIYPASINKSERFYMCLCLFLFPSNESLRFLLPSFRNYDKNDYDSYLIHFMFTEILFLTMYYTVTYGYEWLYEFCRVNFPWNSPHYGSYAPLQPAMEGDDKT